MAVLKMQVVFPKNTLGFITPLIVVDMLGWGSLLGKKILGWQPQETHVNES